MAPAVPAVRVTANNARSKRKAALIPASVLDFESQRQLITGLFFLLQAWKVYDLLLVNTQNSSGTWFIFKYWTLDSLLLALVPVINIPHLPMSPNLAIVLILLINSTTFVLTMDFASFFGAVSAALGLNSVSKDLQINEVLVDAVQNMESEHFKGKKKIRLNPESFIKLNPNGNQHCLKPVYNSHVLLNYDLDSFNGIHGLQLNHLDFNNNLQVFNYTHADLQNSLLKVTEPGYYSIKSAWDMKDKPIKVQRTDNFVPICPEASFVRLPQYQLCESEAESDAAQIQAQIFGVPPFNLVVHETINGQPYKTNTLKGLIPDNFRSPLVLKDEYNLKELSWMKSTTIQVPVSPKDLKPGKYQYQILKIVDGFGNQIDYHGDKDEVTSAIEILQNPTFELRDPNPQVPILLGKKKYLNIQIDNCQDHEPVVIDFMYRNQDVEENFQRTFQQTQGNTLLVEKPGEYFITGGSCSKCHCKSIGNKVSITEARLPNFEIKLDEIVDKCVGVTGFHFNFDFIEGSAPFEIGYKISKLDPQNSKNILKVESISKLISSKNQLEYKFNPHSEGSYAIEFINLSDKYYQNQIKFQDGDHKYITYFKQRPQVSLRQSHVKLCNGGSTQLEVNLDGRFPFNLKYHIQNPDGKVESFEAEVNSNPYLIETPDFTLGGKYQLQLISAEDSSLCDVEYGNKLAIIDVNEEVPKINFAPNYLDHYEIVEGTFVQVPLSQKGQMELTYSHENDLGQVETFLLRNTNGFLKLSKAGTYSLVEFNQGGCPGEVSSDSKVSVSYLPKPKIFMNDDTIQDGLKPSICLNCQDSISVGFQGKSPFAFEYAIVKPNGDIDNEYIENITDAVYEIPLITDQQGQYKYIIKSVFDSLYHRDILKSLESQGFYSFEHLTVHHQVNELPYAQFLRSNTLYESCVLNPPDDVEPINISFNGVGPFDVELHLIDDDQEQRKTLGFHSDSPLLNLDSLYNDLEVGHFTLKIASVTDSNGCSDTIEDEQIFLSINDLPNVDYLYDESRLVEDDDERYYCVGDHISYALIGQAPFYITYEFNEDLQKSVKVPNSIFKRRAPGPGQLSIKSLKDAIGCEINFTNKVNKVYDLPSVEIVQGDHIEEDVYEGERVEITFKLIGEAPFHLTWVRLDIDDETKIVDTESIENIQSNEYKMWASLEGTYEAMVIQDRHCIAKNPKFY